MTDILDRSNDAVRALGRGDVRRIRASDRGREIVVRSGVVWITRDGDMRDHVLSEGQSLSICPGRAALMQALRMARVELNDVNDRPRHRWWETRQRCA